jgi:hypothetical protein
MFSLAREHVDIAEAVVIDGNATNATVADLDAYFEAKYGL